MGTPFGHPYKSFEAFMSITIRKEYSMQIWGTIGPTISIKRGYLGTQMTLDLRSDAIWSLFWGVPNNFYFIQLFDWRPSVP